MLKYVNIVGCFLYGLIILAILLSHDRSFRTPFWIFFISGGVYGIYCVLVFDIDWSWDAPSAIVRRATSTISALAHTIAKLYVGISRYAVLRSKYLTDNKWNHCSVVAMLAVQFLLPTLVCVPFAFEIVRIISAVLYGAYVASGLVLTVLSMRRLRFLLGVARRSKKKQTISTVRQEAVITIYSSMLFLAHSLKCVQQILFVVFDAHSKRYADILLLYPYINDVAVFSSPVLLLITSAKLRRLLYSYFRRPKTTLPIISATISAQSSQMPQPA